MANKSFLMYRDRGDKKNRRETLYLKSELMKRSLVMYFFVYIWLPQDIDEDRRIYHER